MKLHMEHAVDEGVAPNRNQWDKRGYPARGGTKTGGCR